MYQEERIPVVYSDAALKTLRFRVAAGRSCFPMHWHDRMELLRIRQGNLLLDVGNEQLLLTENDISILPPRTPHKGVAQTDVYYDVLMFDARAYQNGTLLCSRFLQPLIQNHIQLQTKTDDSALLSAFDAVFAQGLDPDLETVANMYRLIGRLTHHIVGERPQTVHPLIDYLEGHWTQKVTMEQLCRTFGYTSAHLCRKFKAATGLTPMVYLRIFRLEQARRMLRTDRSIGQIAQDCGFDDANYFTRCFTAHFGRSPRAYKKGNT